MKIPWLIHFCKDATIIVKKTSFFISLIRKLIQNGFNKRIFSLIKDELMFKVAIEELLLDLKIL